MWYKSQLSISLLVLTPLTLFVFVVPHVNHGTPDDEKIFPDLTCHLYYRKGYLEVGNKMCTSGSQLRENFTHTYPKIADSRSCVLFGLGMIDSRQGTGRYFFNYTKSKSTLKTILGAKQVEGRREKVEMDIFINLLLKRFETCLAPISNMTRDNKLNSTHWGPMLDCTDKATGCGVAVRKKKKKKDNHGH